MNTYTGYVVPNTWLLYKNSFDLLFSSSATIPIIVNASSNATAEFSWDVLSWQTISSVHPLSGYFGIDIYTTVDATPGEWLKIIDPMFIKGTEPLQLPSFGVFVDQTAPPVVSRIGPADGITVSTWPVSFDWAASSDTGAGLSWYQIVLSTSPTFSSPFLVYQTTWTSFALSWSFFPSWPLFWYVVAVDNVGNASVSSIGHFVYGSNNGSNGSPWGTITKVLVKDDCAVDKSPSYYDWLCDAIGDDPTQWTISWVVAVGSGDDEWVVIDEKFWSPLPDNESVYSPIPLTESLDRPVVVNDEETALVITEINNEITIKKIPVATIDDAVWSEDLFACDPLLHNCEKEYKGGDIELWLDSIYDDYYTNDWRNKKLLEFYVFWYWDYNRSLARNIILKDPKKKDLKKLTKKDYVI